MAVLLRSTERQQGVIEEALERAGIPAWFARGARRPDPAGRAVLALLGCAREGLSETSFAEYLSLGQAPVTGTWRWESMILRAGVACGRDRWHTRLRTLPESDDREELIDWVLPLIDQLAELPEAAGWGEWLTRIEQLAEYALQRPSLIYELLDELQPMADIGPLSLSDVLTTLEPRLRTLYQDAVADRYGRVFVGSVDAARGLRFRLVFLPGMTEGQFPRVVAEDPLLPNASRQKISPDLALVSDADERRLFDIAMSRSSDRVVLSWSHIDVLAGRERVPSLYLLETQDARSVTDEPVSVGRLFYSTLRANYQTFDVPISDLTRTRVDLLLATIDRAIEKGFLPAAPREGACERCEFLPVCGPWEEERCKQKHQPALRPLKDVRGTP
jgi:superfamily I DNA/RNA helicase